MKNVMTYKGYMARIGFDPRDNIFFGKVMGIEGSITFHGDTIVQHLCVCSGFGYNPHGSSRQKAHNPQFPFPKRSHIGSAGIYVLY